jgi:hypothetical protein
VICDWAIEESRAEFDNRYVEIKSEREMRMREEGQKERSGRW